MALKTAYSFRGLAVPEAYIRLENVTGGKQRGSWTGEFSIYQSETAANPPQPKVEVKAKVEKLPDGLPPEPEPVVVKVQPQPPLAGFSVSTPWVKDAAPETLLYAAAKEQAMLAEATDA